MTERDAAVVFENQEDVAGMQIRLCQLPADGCGHPCLLERNRIAIEQAHPDDFGSQRTAGQAQTIGHIGIRQHIAQGQYPVVNRIAVLAHVLGKALQRRDVLKGLRPRHKAAFALQGVDQAFLLQARQCLAHRDPAGGIARAQFAFGRHTVAGLELPIEDGLSQGISDPLIQRGVVKGGDGGCGTHFSTRHDKLEAV